MTPDRYKQIKDIFLEGLYWRSPSSFGEQTHNLIGFFLEDASDDTRNETLEVLLGLASKKLGIPVFERLAELEAWIKS